LILVRAAAADEDIESIWLYVARDSERAADRLIDRLEAVTARLETFPELGVARDDLGVGIRALRVNYVAFYRRRGDNLVLERVLHARLDVTQLRF
jgi:toxin ParE1/3/4